MVALLEAKLQEIRNELGSLIDAGTVKLIAVSKYASDEQVIEAYHLGIRNFGENYVAPAIERKKRLEHFFVDKVEWHFLGHLQKNKVNKAVGEFEMIHSLDSLELAKKINQRAESLGIVQDVLIQINTTEDKYGFDPEDAEMIFDTLQELKNINVKGLMTMGFPDADKNETIFAKMRQLVGVLNSKHPQSFLGLSMGMSNDYQLAVKYGSTMVRLGRALFGV